jgi:hypothetical protein
LKRFVHNRVTEIQSFTENASWNYCPTGDNPVDLLTRGMQTGELSTSTLWSRGPSWLNTKKNWPSWNSKSVLLQSTAAEQLEAISSESTNNPTNVPEPKHGIAKLYPLEVRATTSFGICPTTDEPSDEKDQPSENPPQREKRSAAVAAKKKIKGWTSSLLCPPEDVVK